LSWSPMLLDSVQAIRLVAERLDSLAERVVFLGGATLGLFITGPGAAPPRPTKDVDLIVEITMPEYLGNSFRFQLLSRGFREVTDERVICRWEIEGTKVDIMPATAEIFGFSNSWYPTAVAQAQRYQLADGPNIRLISPPCFLATKLEAFANRGQGDFLSHDLEDVISVIDGRPTIEKEIESATPEIREFLARELARLLASQAFLESLHGQLRGDSAGQARLPGLIARLHRIARTTPRVST
jgi:predicted nucleotidyltransferase